MRNLLIIEDDESTLNSLVITCSSENLKIDTATNGNIGWELFQKNKYPVVITDLRMNNSLDGIIVLEKIKKNSPETEVIIITAHGGEEDAIKSVNLHAFGYIKKGTPSGLKINEMLDKAFLSYETKTGFIDWATDLKSDKRPDISLDELGKVLKKYPLIPEEVEG